MARIEMRAKNLGLHICGECRYWKKSMCERTHLRFPALKSDIVCKNFVHKRK